jgi:hypothetical protein
MQILELQSCWRAWDRYVKQVVWETVVPPLQRFDDQVGETPTSCWTQPPPGRGIEITQTEIPRLAR